MFTFEDAKEILGTKHDEKKEAIDIAIKVIEQFKEDCPGDGCDLTSNPPYHWRGCTTKLQPIINNLRFIRKN